MLVLQRHRSEEIYIGGGAARGGVTITVVEVRDGWVKLGITAPREIVVHRAEVQDRIDAGERREGEAT